MYDLSDFVTEIQKFWVYDIIDMPETWINEETNMYPAIWRMIHYTVLFLPLL